MRTKQFVEVETEGLPTSESPMIEKSWDDFRKTGLFLFINSFLHIFGWCLLLKCDENNSCYEVIPARTSHRGFEEKFVEEDYQKLTKYMADNSKQLLKEISE